MPLLRRGPQHSLNFERQGEGEPLVLVHGIGGELCAWEPVLEPLADRFDVIAVDLPGFGRSPALPTGDEPSPARLAAAVACLLGELGLESAHVAGNSLGGWVALELAIAGRARSVTGLCPAGLWGAPLRREGPPTRGRLNRFARMIRPLIPVLMLSRRARMLALGHLLAHPERVSYGDARRMVSSYARATAYDATNWAMQTHALTDLDQIGPSTPVTVAFGERDRLIRPHRIAVPGARTLMLPDCGHIPMWDDPGLVTRVISETAARAPRQSDARRRAG